MAMTANKHSHKCAVNRLKVRDAIVRFMAAEGGRSPTSREIAMDTGLSFKVAMNHMNYIAKKGWIEGFFVLPSGIHAQKTTIMDEKWGE